jgi:Cytochrome c554 and c-prime
MKRMIAFAGAALLLCSGASAQNYVGDQACLPCHTSSPTPDFFDAYARSGHRWKIHRTGGNVPDPGTWPHTPVPPLPTTFGAQLQWSDVEYVIGNFFWKARFIDRNGFIHTGDVGDETQWNIATQGWVPYHAGETKPFDCGRCHTTGYEPTGNQLGLPGLIGTWAYDGVQCEACHGPASEHITNPVVIKPTGGKACSECHYRDAQSRMPWKGGFMRHHQQAEELKHSSHANNTCTSCHDQHRSTVYNDGGVDRQCTECHTGSKSNTFYSVKFMENVDCIDCHMPDMGKSAVAENQYKGDVRGHLFWTMTAPIAAVDNTYDEGGTLYWKQNRMGQSFITLDYVCLGCHTSGKTLQEASAFAVKIHDVNNACYADRDQSTGRGVLDIFDFLAFQNLFVSNDPYACDCDTSTGSGICDIFDFLCFQDAFVAGCP